MHIILNKYINLTCTNDEWITLQEQLDKYIIVENKAYITKLNMGLSVRDELQHYALADIKYANGGVKLKAPIGLWDFVKHLFPEPIDQRPIFNTKKEQQFATTFPTTKEYEYQPLAVQGMVPFHNGILKARPGSGKTRMGLMLGLTKGKSFLWINDRIDLCKQAMKTLINQLGIPEEMCGLLQGDNEQIKPYTFTTIQKLHKVLNQGFNNVNQELIHFDTILIDECHHAVGSFNSYKTYFQAFMELDYKYIYGLTATDKRIDGNEHLVYSLLGPVRYEVTTTTKTLTAQVINKHYHVPITEEQYREFVNRYTMKAMPHKVDEFLLYNEGYLDLCLEKILEVISKFNKVLLISPRVAAAQLWSRKLEEHGIENFLVYGAIKKRERLYTDKVLVATLDLVKEGFDVPDLEAIVVMSRPLHKLLRTQVIGRCERFMEGKKEPLALFITPHIKRVERNETPWKEVELSELAGRSNG